MVFSMLDESILRWHVVCQWMEMNLFGRAAKNHFTHQRSPDLIHMAALIAPGGDQKVIYGHFEKVEDSEQTVRRTGNSLGAERARFTTGRRSAP